MEWANVSKYNSFNSYKGLTYYDHYQKIGAWLKNEGRLPAPIEASLDPMNACNDICYYCNSQCYLRDHPSKLQQWDRQFIADTLVRLADWGVGAFCWGGGGESLMNRNIRGMTKFGIDLGMECAIITNGALLDDELIDELLLCRWIGISLDSCVPQVYEVVRGRDDCVKVLSNIAKLVKRKAELKSKTDICAKVLILPETIDTIAETCQVVKQLGVQDFHVRPVDLERNDFKVAQRLNLDIPKIQGIFEECHAMETPTFHVYTVTHKYNNDFHVEHKFKKCLASPLVMQICTDKKTYLCVDHRLDPRFEVKGWGSAQHRELVLGVNPDKECGKCTWSEYNRQMEECVTEDRLCRNFP